MALDEILEEQPEGLGPVGLAQDALLDLAHAGREAAHVGQEGRRRPGGVRQGLGPAAGIRQGALQPAQHLQHGAAIRAGLAPFEPRQLLQQEPRLGVELHHRHVAFAALDQPAGVEEAPVERGAALGRIGRDRLVATDLGIAPAGGEIADLGEQFGLAHRLGPEDAPVQVQQEGRVEAAARGGQRLEQLVGQLREQHCFGTLAVAQR